MWTILRKRNTSKIPQKNPWLDLRGRFWKSLFFQISSKILVPDQHKLICFNFIYLFIHILGLGFFFRFETHNLKNQLFALCSQRRVSILGKEGTLGYSSNFLTSKNHPESSTEEEQSTGCTAGSRLGMLVCRGSTALLWECTAVRAHLL